MRGMYISSDEPTRSVRAAAYGHLIIGGESHRGMTNGAASARILTDLICDRENPWAESFEATRLSGAITSSSFYKENFDVVGKHLIGDRLKTLRPPSAEDLEPGDGGICEWNGEKAPPSATSPQRAEPLQLRFQRVCSASHWNRSCGLRGGEDLAGADAGVGAGSHRDSTIDENRVDSYGSQ